MTRPLRGEQYLLYWLLRAYESGHREGWEAGPSISETMDRILDVLANAGLDPGVDKDAAAVKALLDREPQMGAKSRTAIAVDALREIVSMREVCADFEVCTHATCNANHAMYETAHEALAAMERNPRT